MCCCYVILKLYFYSVGARWVHDGCTVGKWWVTRMFDTIQKVESEDPSVQAAATAINYKSAIMQIPNGLLAISDSLQRMARVGETALACTWKMTWRDVLASWGKTAQKRVTAATFFHYFPGETDSVYSNKLKMLMKDQFRYNSTHHKFGVHYERGFCYQPAFVEALKAKENKLTFQYYPWELLDVLRYTYRTTGIGLNQAPTSDVTHTMSMDRNGRPVFWAAANMVGKKAIDKMICKRQTNELRIMLGELTLFCHLLILLWE